jgi:hypothetical protein
VEAAAAAEEEVEGGDGRRFGGGCLLGTTRYRRGIHVSDDARRLGEGNGPARKHGQRGAGLRLQHGWMLAVSRSRSTSRSAAAALPACAASRSAALPACTRTMVEAGASLAWQPAPAARTPCRWTRRARSSRRLGRTLLRRDAVRRLVGRADAARVPAESWNHVKSFHIPAQHVGCRFIPPQHVGSGARWLY